MWGYKPIPGATSPEAEKPTLDRWAREQDRTPWFRFSTADSRGADPGELTEAVGDADAVKATTLGLKNLERICNLLLTASTQDGENYDDLRELYGRLLGQWATEMTHVTAIIGGMNSQNKVAGQDGVRFSLLPRARQQEAVRFLNANAFTTPKFFLKPEILRRIEPDGALSRVRQAQLRVLSSLLSNARLARMAEQEALDGAGAYGPAEMMADVRNGVWSELAAPQVQIDVYRRNLQRAYLELLNTKLNGTGAAAATDDARALARAELQALSVTINAAMPKAGDRLTRAHLADARDRIAKSLDPKFAPPAAPAGPGGFPGFPGGDDDDQPKSCWPDYIIQPIRQ
jgi:hypothetical protein